jgi:cell division protein FtsW (lipid II flippase)
MTVGVGGMDGGRAADGRLGGLVAVGAGSLAPRARRRRGAELALLLLALVISAGAYASVGLNRTGRLEPGRAWPLGGLALLVLLAHVVVRIRLPWADPVLLPAATLLNGLGLVLIHVLDDIHADAAVAAGDPAPRAVAETQLVWTALGVLVFVAIVLLLRDHRLLARATYLCGLGAILLLLLPLVPHLGQRISGARIWISAFGFSFQPGEVAKIALAVFYAGYLAVKRDALAVAGRRIAGIDLPRPRDLGPIGLAWLLSVGVLVFEQDLGTSLLLFGLFVVMLYVATERFSWVVLGAVLFAGGAAFGYHRFPYVQARFAVWLHPFAAANATPAYQIIQALFGMANGGLLGTGLGLGQPQLVPLAESDFIFSTLAENLGLTGVMAVLVLYGLLVERGLRASLLCRDAFGKLLALGLSFTLALQVFIVLGGVTKLIPLTGLTTPFMSAGGSSLVANWAVIALLLVISDRARRPATGSGRDATTPDAGAPDDSDQRTVGGLR